MELLKKVLSARYIIAIILTIVFSYKELTGTTSTEFITVYSMIMTFYFVAKKRGDGVEN